jgi:hypothetical protein
MDTDDYLGVAVLIGFGGCPIHDGEFFSSMLLIGSIDELKKLIILGINESHVSEFLSFDDDKYEVRYEGGRHSYTGAQLVINNNVEFATIDNGSGSLIWVDNKDR